MRSQSGHTFGHSSADTALPNRSSPCTLILSFRLRTFLIRSIRSSALTPSEWFERLIFRFQQRLPSLIARVRQRPRTRYQPSSSDLTRWNFRIHTRVWLQLKVLARGMNISICFLVSILLSLVLELGSRTGNWKVKPSVAIRLEERLVMSVGRIVRRLWVDKRLNVDTS